MTTSATLHLPTIMTAPDEIISAGIGRIAFHAAAGAVAGLAFGLINPIGGAIFGAAVAASGMLGRAVIDSLSIQEEGVKTALRITLFIISIKLGIAATALIGFTMSTFGAIGMVLSMTVITVLTQHVCANANSGGRR